MHLDLKRLVEWYSPLFLDVDVVLEGSKHEGIEDAKWLSMQEKASNTICQCWSNVSWFYVYNLEDHDKKWKVVAKCGRHL